MKAAVMAGYHQPLVFQDVPIPILKPDEVRLKVLSAGICSTDLHIRDGKMPSINLPHILGHEIIGIADEFGSDVFAIQKGKNYIAAIDVVCGNCFFCRSNRPNLCINRERLGFERYGGFAEFVNVPARNLVAYPDSLPVAQGAIIPDAVACMFHTLVDQSKVTKDQRIILIGLGGLGFQGIQIAKHFGASVIATSRNPQKVEIGFRLGAQAVCTPSKSEITNCAQRLWGTKEADAVIDNIGTPETITLSLDLCRRGGKVLVVGYDTFQVSINLYDLMLNEKEIIGVRGSTYQNLLESVELAKQKFITPFVSNEYDFENINQAFNDLQNGHVISRSVIHMN